MAVLSLAPLKAFLRVFVTSDDELLLDLLEASEAEALQYMDRTDMPRAGEDEAPDECDTSVILNPASDGTSMAPDVRVAIYYLVQAKYEAKDAEEVRKLRDAAIQMLAAHRRHIGV